MFNLNLLIMLCSRLRFACWAIRRWSDGSERSGRWTTKVCQCITLLYHRYVMVFLTIFPLFKLRSLEGTGWPPSDQTYRTNGCMLGTTDAREFHNALLFQRDVWTRADEVPERQCITKMRDWSLKLYYHRWKLRVSHCIFPCQSYLMDLGSVRHSRCMSHTTFYVDFQDQKRLGRLDLWLTLWQSANECCQRICARALAVRVYPIDLNRPLNLLPLPCCLYKRCVLCIINRFVSLNSGPSDTFELCRFWGVNHILVIKNPC